LERIGGRAASILKGMLTGTVVWTVGGAALGSTGAFGIPQKPGVTMGIFVGAPLGAIVGGIVGANARKGVERAPRNSRKS
jgi:hypothetical protein